jgi:MoxR-like ATPase
MDLSDYLERQYGEDRSAVADIQSLADRALETLVGTQLEEGWWPYSLTNGKENTKRGAPSQSTAAMVLHAIAVAYGVITNSVLVPAVRMGTGVKRDAAKVSELLERGTLRLISSLNPPEQVYKGASLTTSNTWGDDDPMTLTWLYELLAAGVVDDEAKSRPAIDAIKYIAQQGLTTLTNDPQSVTFKSALDDDDHGDNENKIEHPFPMLRSLQLARAVNVPKWSDVSFSKLPATFLSQLHAELSNSAVRDGGFDPACLVFALEGLLLINADAVSDALLEQVVTALGGTSSVASHWRPVRPLVATNRGLILLPQSVEVANSYLRICDLYLLKRPAGEPLFTQSFDILQSYADWLMSRAFRVRITGQTPRVLDGWQSEHTFKHNVVHLWATSQVVLFLQHYSAWLQHHVARCSRVAAALDFHRSDEYSGRWAEAQSQEPLAGLPEDSSLRAYNRVNSLFVAPRNDGAKPQTPPSYSILLYGPPGTGKTSFCSDLADGLGYDMIIVTPSDFIRGGGAGVEESAKKVFDVLLSQSNTVILFDEIDRLLLDRDNPMYSSQETMFQFMTPSMLTKLNELRGKEQPVFVIATNYAENIDSAIKRPGRIDEQVLLLPPDLTQRKQIIATRALKAGLSPVELDVDEIARRTPLYVYAELKHLVQTIANSKQAGATLAKATADALGRTGSSTINLNSYQARFQDKDSKLFEDVTRGPWLEFALLNYLRAEDGNYSLNEDWERTVLNQPTLLDALETPIKTTLKGLLSTGA